MQVCQFSSLSPFSAPPVNDSLLFGVAVTSFREASYIRFDRLTVLGRSNRLCDVAFIATAS